MPRHSRLAWFLRGVMVVFGAAALWWFVAHWPHAPGRAMAGAAALVLFGPLMITLQFVLLACFGRSPQAPTPGPAEFAGAWWAECVEVIRVFYWRQPFRWRREPDFLAAECSGRRGVVFVHGFLCNRGIWNPWLPRMRAARHAHVCVNLEPVFASIENHVATLEAAISRVEQATGLPPVLVCHSMGGLAARAWLRASRAPQRVHHVVTIGTPHEGTWLGHFSSHENGREMRIGSPWLRDLAGIERDATSPPFTCWYSNCDNTVFPAHTSMRPGADNRLVRGAAHVDLAFRPEVQEHTLALLRN